MLTYTLPVARCTWPQFPKLIMIKAVVSLIQIAWTLITAAACMGLYITTNSIHALGGTRV